MLYIVSLHLSIERILKMTSTMKWTKTSLMKMRMNLRTMQIQNKKE